MDRRDFLKNGTVLTGAVSSSRLWGLFSEGNVGLDESPQGGGGAPLVNGGELDVSKAVVVAPPTLSKRERKAAQVLVEEIERRTEIRLPVSEAWPALAAARIVVGPPDALRSLGAMPNDLFVGGKLPGREGYTLRVLNGQPPTVAVVGADERGVLFGVGGLLRNLQMDKNQIRVRGSLNVTTQPKYPVRGHQLGYRPKVNSYDGWTAAMMDQYIRELTVFGVNSIELIPPRSDDGADSPNFPIPQKQMMVEMSRICDDYGLDVWIWYPAMDADYSDPKDVEFALNEWGEIFQALPRIDTIWVPAGDPGRTPPKPLLALLEKQAQNLHKYHPRATVWTNTEMFDRAQSDEFFEILARDQPKWLGGFVFSSKIRTPLKEVRARLPKQYPIRLYTDVTHSVSCTFPVPNWDVAFAQTEGREVINPRPEGYANIMRMYLPDSIGLISYSEGCNDDVNKTVCSALAWNPEAKVIDILREYTRYFIGEPFAEGFAQGLLGLEQNWRAPLISNEGVLTVLRQFQAMEEVASPHDLLKWRMQQGLYRAYYDAYVRSRLLYETALEQQAMDRLREVRRLGVRPMPLQIGARVGFSTNQLDVGIVLDQAEALLAKTQSEPVAQDWRARVLELGEALYQSIRMQLAVELYKAEAVVRGASSDTLDAPITNLPWLRRRVREIRALSSPNDRVNAILELLNRTNPGPGGFYDDLGNEANQPHLVRGLGSIKDPEFRASANDGFTYPDAMGDQVPAAWKYWGEARWETPLEMYYPNVDARAQYRVRVVYAGNGVGKKTRLVAGRDLEIHGYIERPSPITPLEFDVPREATAGGDLRLRWYGELGLGGNGTGCQVAEVWLMVKS
jgi:hypothetical protein